MHCWRDTCLYTQRKEHQRNRATAVRKPVEKARPSCAASCVRRPSPQKLRFITISACIRTSSRAARYGQPNARRTSSSSTPHPPPHLWRQVARVNLDSTWVWDSTCRTKWLMGPSRFQLDSYWMATPVLARGLGKNCIAAGTAASISHTRASSPTTSASTQVRSPTSAKYACAFSVADPPWSAT